MLRRNRRIIVLDRRAARHHLIETAINPNLIPPSSPGWPAAHSRCSTPRRCWRRVLMSAPDAIIEAAGGRRESSTPPKGYLDISPLDIAAAISEKSSMEFFPLISKHRSSTEIVAETPIRGLKRPTLSIVNRLDI